jgi:hypothetical protein
MQSMEAPKRNRCQGAFRFRFWAEAESLEACLAAATGRRMQ